MELINITTSNQPPAATSKQLRYLELVQQRKACRACESLGLTNPSVYRDGIYDTEQIGPWSRWQGNLDAPVVVVGQDWGGTEYFNEHEGLDEGLDPAKDEKFNDTNKALCALLDSIGIRIEHTLQPAEEQQVFFTNATLCLRPGRLTTGTARSGWFRNCSSFLRQQVEIVNPKAVITLGHKPYTALLQAFGLKSQARMQDAVNHVTELPNGSVLIPMYHPGYWGTRARSFEQQLLDWQELALHNGRLQ
jgi:DNA polymerase